MNPTTQGKQGVICRNLFKDYGSGDSRVRALKGVDLEIAPGELTLLVGPSGCGKTTLISILAATLDATSGDVSVLGMDLKRLSNREKAAFRAKNVGFVFQQFNLLPSLTAAENVAVPLVINGYSKAAAMARATEVLKDVGLGDRTQSLPSELSGGQRSVSAREAAHLVRTIDRERVDFVKEHFMKDPNDASNFDIVLNVSRLSIVECAELIVETLRRLQGRANGTVSPNRREGFGESARRLARAVPHAIQAAPRE